MNAVSLIVDIGVTRGWNSKSCGWYPSTAEYAMSKIGHNWIPKGLSTVGKGTAFSRSDTLDDIVEFSGVRAVLRSRELGKAENVGIL